MLKSAFLIAIELSIGSRAAFAVCMPISVADQIWSNKQVHWIFVGRKSEQGDVAPIAFAARIARHSSGFICGCLRFIRWPLSTR